MDIKKSKIVNKRKGDTTISGGIKDSNVVISEGPAITNIHTNKFQDYEIPPLDSDFLKAIMVFGRKFINISLKWKLISIVPITLFSIYDFFDFLYLKIIPNPYSSWTFGFSLFWLAFIIVFTGLFFNRRCNKCGKFFALNEDENKNPKILSRGRDPRDNTIKYKVRHFLKCHYCNTQSHKDKFIPLSEED